MKVRDAVLILIFCLFLTGPVFLYLVERMGIEVPVELTDEPAAYLAGGNAEAHVSDFLNIKGFTSKKLQENVDVKLGNSIPRKASAIIVNAELQRQAIAASNLLFSWRCYPTYFASKRLYIPNANAVTYMTEQQNEHLISAWQSFAHGVVAAADRHPDKRFVLYIVDGYQEPTYNPAYNLTSNPLASSDCVDTMNKILGSSPNVRILTTPPDGELYYNNFFRTDHHWNINGAFEAYGQIADELNLQKQQQDGTWQIPDYLFTGATARWGVDLLQETVFDCGNQFSQLIAIYPDGSQIRGDDHSAFWNSPPISKPYRFYDAYYDNLGACTIIGGEGSLAALLVGNSYRGAIQRPLAMSYHSLTVNSQLHPSTPIEETPEDQVIAANANDIIFVANPSGYCVEDKYWN